MYYFLFISTILSLLHSYFMPHSFDFRTNLDARASCCDGLSSNSIINLEYVENKMYMGTTNSLNFGVYDESGEISYGNYCSSVNMVQGTNPALAIKNHIIAVSGAESTETNSGSQPKGLGVSFSIDAGLTWKYIQQPIDDLSESMWGCAWLDDDVLYSTESECDSHCIDCSGDSKDCIMYNYISWGGQNNIRNLSVTTDIQNISYDLAILGDYIYAASWAGSLRRFKYNDENPSWEVVPLPMDNQITLNCGQINPSTYQINPAGNFINNQFSDDCGYDFDNHKVFSVHSVEDTLWVGTASGINKGVINSSDCINWKRMTSSEYGFYDDWIIGFEHEIFEDGSVRLWAITWDRRYDGSHLVYGGPPSYTDNGGESWHIVDFLADQNIVTYNISTHSSGVYTSSNKGLYESENSILWQKIIQDHSIHSETVLDADLVEGFTDLWIASNPVEIRNYNSGESIIASACGNVDLAFYAYPNPIIGDNHSIFVFNGSEENINGTITIYDFSMDKVNEINGSGYTTWNGRNIYGNRVANGIYLCNYKQGGQSFNFNIMVINK